METKRIIAFDLGNKFNGVAVVDFTGSDYKVKALECIEGEIDYTTFDTYINTNTVVLYENCFMHKNWVLMRKQKALRQHFANLGVHMRALLPSQKAIPTKVAGKKNNDRKQVAEREAKSLLHGSWLDVFMSYERRHDVADAFLMCIYAVRNPKVLQKPTKKKTSK